MKSSSSRLRRIATVVVLTFCVAQLTLSQIVLKRRITVDLAGEPGAGVIVIVTADGVTTKLLKKLPAEFEYHAKQFQVEARYSNAKAEGGLSASIKRLTKN